MALTQISTEGIKNGTITNADIGSSAAIAGTKISPDFGSQNIATTGTLTLGTVPGTNTNAALNVLFQTASGVIDGGSQLTYNPGGDVLSVNGNHISANTFRGDGNTGTLTCDNHSSTTFVTVSNTVDISTVDNATDAFTVKQGSNEYITVDTNNSSELITLGNTTTNPKTAILGGNVGIGTTSPAALLTLNQTIPELRLQSSNNNLGMGDFIGLISLHTSDGSTPGAGEVFRIKTESSSSIGADYTTRLYNRNGAGGGATEASFGNGQGSIYLSTNTTGNATASVRMAVMSDGKVGIGTTSPSNNLEVASADHTGILIQSNRTTATDNIGAVDFRSSSTDVARIQSLVDGTIKFRNTSALTERMRINSAGKIGINYSGNPPSEDVMVCTAGQASPAGLSLSHLSGGNRYGARLSTISGTNSGVIFSTLFNSGYEERMRINSSGKVGIGTSSPSRTISAHVSDSGANYIHLTNTGTGTGDANGTFIGVDAAEGALIWNQENNYVRFGTNNVERVRIDADGKVGIGTTSPIEILHIKEGTNKNLQFTGSIGQIGNVTGFFAVNDANDTIEDLGMMGDTLRFATGSAASGAERMRIDSSGRVGIGTTSPNRTIHTHVNNSGANYHQFTNSACGTADTDGSFVGIDSGEDLIVWNQEVNAIRLATSNTERMRISSDGKVRIGDSLTTAAAGKFQVVEESGVDQANDANVYFETNAVDWNLKLYYNTTGAHYHIVFVEQGTQRGYIAGADGSNVTYTSGSDYRWKENIVDLSGSEGIEICKKLKPRKYNWIENREVTGEINTVDGFIAHEVEEAGVTGAVSGEKDAVYEDGSIKGQTLDYGQMTPVLAAAIKGLISKVEVLETEVAELKAA